MCYMVAVIPNRRRISQTLRDKLDNFTDSVFSEIGIDGSRVADIRESTLKQLDRCWTSKPLKLPQTTAARSPGRRRSGSGRQSKS